MEEPEPLRNLIRHPPTLLDRFSCLPSKPIGWYEIDAMTRLVEVETRQGPEIVLRTTAGGVFQYVRLGNKRAELLAVTILELLKSSLAENARTLKKVAKPDKADA